MAPQLIRVCLIGPECTGKTTLAEELSVHFGAPWVPEFAREYAQRVGRELTADDVEPIARGEMALLDAALNLGVGSGEWRVEGDGQSSHPPHPTPHTPLLIFDTDLISTVVYARRYYGHCPEWIESAAVARKADLYLLLDIDLPWVPDSLRDSATPRESLYAQFAQTLKTYEANVITITGERFKAAVTQLDSLLDRPPAAARTPHR
ncbi:MAG TPA: ATP-binding protein [Thermoanaerobaculia bacterium]|nr:ATP-binding protein [Thermoanaerobaculia bacterium]